MKLNIPTAEQQRRANAELDSALRSQELKKLRSHIETGLAEIKRGSPVKLDIPIQLLDMPTADRPAGLCGEAAAMIQEVRAAGYRVETDYYKYYGFQFSMPKKIYLPANERDTE